MPFGENMTVYWHGLKKRVLSLHISSEKEVDLNKQLAFFERKLKIFRAC